MRDIKFNYLWKYEQSIATAVYTIEDIEKGCAKPPRSRCGSIMKGWELVARRQYTGLKDKNGVEIYEGDIATCSIFTVNLEIYYQEDLGMARLAHGDSDEGDFLEYNSELFEVIGNIHQNPELKK